MVVWRSSAAASANEFLADLVGEFRTVGMLVGIRGGVVAALDVPFDALAARGS
jgi:hypothetical protein